MRKRNRATIGGINFTGDPAGVVTPWGGGAAGATTPGLGVLPTITIPIDDDDDGNIAADVKSSQAAQRSRKSARDSTASRLRSQLKTIANFIAFASQFLSQLVAGTRSVASLVADGVGGNVVAPPSGTVTATASGFGTALPTPTVVGSVLYKELVPFAYGVFSITAGPSPTITFVGGFNVSSIVRSSAGLYLITFTNTATNGTKLVVLANSSPNSGAALFTTGSATSNTTCNVLCLDLSGTRVDAGSTTTIMFVAYGS